MGDCLRVERTFDSSRGVLSNLSIVHYVQKGIKQILFQSDKNLALQVSETHY